MCPFNELQHISTAKRNWSALFHYTAAFFTAKPKVKPGQVVLIGSRSLDPRE